MGGKLKKNTAKKHVVQQQHGRDTTAAAAQSHAARRPASLFLLVMPLVTIFHPVRFLRGFSSNVLVTVTVFFRGFSMLASLPILSSSDDPLFSTVRVVLGGGSASRGVIFPDDPASRRAFFGDDPAPVMFSLAIILPPVMFSFVTILPPWCILW